MTTTPSQPERRTTVIRRGLDLLSRRDHFTGDLANRLTEAGFPAEEVTEAVETLRSQGLLDDQRLANHQVRRWRSEGRSEAECRARLAAREVPAGIIDETIRLETETTAPEDDPDLAPDLKAAIKVLGKAMGSGGSPPSPTRLAPRLARRGFDPDTIRAALRHYGLDDSGIEPEAGVPPP